MDEYVLVDQTELRLRHIVGAELVQAGVGAHGGQVGAAAAGGQTILKCQTFRIRAGIVRTDNPFS